MKCEYRIVEKEKRNLHVPTMKNRKLTDSLRRVNRDKELLQLWKCANVNAVDRSGISDHGEVHIQIVANAALKLFRLMVRGGVEPGVVKDHGLKTEDAEVVVVLAACLHDVGISVHRDDHEKYSLLIAYPKIRELLDDYEFPGDDTPIIIGSALKALEGDESEIGVPSIVKLVEALDSYIPEPERAIDQPFLMPIEDVFSISGRGTVVTGRIERGVVKVGEEIEIVGVKETTTTTCTGVEMFRKLLDEGRAGDNVGVLLRGTKRDEVERGQVLAKPGSITPPTVFECEVYVLSKDEGGRHTPFFNNYRPQFYFRTTDITGACELPEGVEMVMPGDNVKMTVTMINPIAMEDGLRFAIREGGRTVGAGVVSKIIE